jgi:hypothetical protein
MSTTASLILEMKTGSSVFVSPAAFLAPPFTSKRVTDFVMPALAAGVARDPWQRLTVSPTDGGARLAVPAGYISDRPVSEERVSR